eukprot:Awhi_evm1s11519
MHMHLDAFWDENNEAKNLQQNGEGYNTSLDGHCHIISPPSEISIDTCTTNSWNLSNLQMSSPPSCKVELADSPNMKNTTYDSVFLPQVETNECLLDSAIENSLLQIGIDSVSEMEPFSVHLPIDRDLTRSSPESLNNCQFRLNCFQNLSFFDDFLDLENNFDDFPCCLSNAPVSIRTSDIDKKISTCKELNLDFSISPNLQFDQPLSIVMENETCWSDSPFEAKKLLSQDFSDSLNSEVCVSEMMDNTTLCDTGLASASTFTDKLTDSHSQYNADKAPSIYKTGSKDQATPPRTTKKKAVSKEGKIKQKRIRKRSAKELEVCRIDAKQRREKKKLE